VQVLLSLAAALLVLAGIQLASSVLVPVILAIGLAIAFQPIGTWVKRRGLPPIVTVGITVAAVSALVGAAAFVLVAAFGDLAEALPRYQRVATAWRNNFAGWLDSHHLSALGATLRKGEPGTYLGSMVANSAAVLGQVAQTLAFVVLLTVFIQLEASSFPARLRAILGSVQRSRESVERTMSALSDIQRYMLVKIAASLLRAALVAALAWVIGLDQVLLWATIAFALNFVPVLGPLAASAPPVVSALLTIGPGAALLLGAGLLMVGVVVGSLAEPRIMGRVVGLSPLVVVLAITLWGFVLGPIGAMLAVPLTMVAKLMLAENPRYGWLARLLSYRPIPRIALLRRYGFDRVEAREPRPATEPLAPLPPPEPATDRAVA
jgi:AI-2 transport protein TqsA